jgi:hypothetical protein
MSISAIKCGAWKQILTSKGLLLTSDVPFLGRAFYMVSRLHNGNIQFLFRQSNERKN